MFTSSGLHVRFMKVFERSNYETVDTFSFLLPSCQLHAIAIIDQMGALYDASGLLSDPHINKLIVPSSRPPVPHLPFLCHCMALLLLCLKYVFILHSEPIAVKPCILVVAIFFRSSRRPQF
jgi:hypothetical protein